MYKLFKKGLINKRTLLILNYSKIKINENQLSILLLIMELSNENKQNFTSSELEKYMSISKETIDQEISFLLKNKFIKIIKNGKKTIFDLDYLFKSLINVLHEEYLNLLNSQSFNFIEDKLNCTLTSEQVEVLNNYLDHGIKIEKIVDILNENQLTNVEELFEKLNECKKNKKVKVTMYN